tara:strand:+ start:14399 stop:14821 length:423 start_codon:yes stop_codon:yes gene_type:complete
MANFKPTGWHMEVGLNHVGAYQVSGKPFAKQVNAHSLTHVAFPNVTRWVQIYNHDVTNELKVGFSSRGISSESNYFTIAPVGSGSVSGRTSVIGPLELKVTQLWLSGSDSVSIVAGLTSIEPDKAKTSDGENWSGSAGVG